MSIKSVTIVNYGYSASHHLLLRDEVKVLFSSPIHCTYLCNDYSIVIIIDLPCVLSSVMPRHARREWTDERTEANKSCQNKKFAGPRTRFLSTVQLFIYEERVRTCFAQIFLSRPLPPRVRP